MYKFLMDGEINGWLDEWMDWMDVWMVEVA
jgi:hypothetical protein